MSFHSKIVVKSHPPGQCRIAKSFPFYLCSLNLFIYLFACDIARLKISHLNENCVVDFVVKTAQFYFMVLFVFLLVTFV